MTSCQYNGNIAWMRGWREYGQNLNEIYHWNGSSVDRITHTNGSVIYSKDKGSILSYHNGYIAFLGKGDILSNNYYPQREQIYIISNKDSQESMVQGFVTRFYQQCLNRNPDTAGLNGWINALLAGTLCGADVANGFIFSEEFTNRDTSKEEFVTILYSAFFGREPDTSGYNGWVKYLYGGASRQDVLNGFLYSQEFEDLCNSYGIAPYIS